MPPPQPLGRNLIPLAGESLPGFLLRLSFRLNLAPAELAAVTGLTAAGNAGSPRAVTLTAVPETARLAFTHMTRLTDSQVTGLGLASWRERYPLPGEALQRGHRSRPTEGRIYSSVGIVHSGARQQTDPSGFEAGLRSLARELSAPGTPLVNYQRRRRPWRTGPSVSPPGTASLPGCRLQHARGRPTSETAGARSRPSTSGSASPSASPASPPAPSRPPSLRLSRNTGDDPGTYAWWRLLTSDNPGSTYSCLRAELDVLATALATTIDPSHPADSTLGTAPLYVSRYPRRPRKPRTLTATIGSAGR